MEEELQSYRINISSLEIAGAGFRVAGALARGGCSVILKVEAMDGGEELALKVPFRFDELFTNRQGNSATALRKSEKALWEEIHNFHRVESPHTLRCYFKGSISINHNRRTVTFPAILMELALANLHHILANHSIGHNPIPIGEKIKIVDQLLESTAYLHANNLVHRDISPPNIFVVRRGPHIRYIVSDFGSARQALSGDGDILRTIDVLARDVGIIGLFSDWPATTTVDKLAPPVGHPLAQPTSNDGE